MARILRMLFIISLLLIFHAFRATYLSPQLKECPSSKITGKLNTVRAPTGHKALVTGAAGFIGSHVANDCLNLGFEEVAVDDMSGGFRRNVPNGVRLIIGDLKDASG